LSTGLAGGGGFCGPVLQKEEKDTRVDDAAQAEELKDEGPVMAVGNPAAEAAEAGADHDAAQVDAVGERACLVPVVVHQQGAGRGEVAGLAEAQEAAIEQQLAVAGRMRREPGGRGPGEEREDDDAAAVELVGDETAEGTQQAVGDQKDRRQQSELGVGHRDGLLDRRAHRDKDHPVQIVQERGEPKQAHHEPSLAHRVTGGVSHLGQSDC